MFSEYIVVMNLYNLYDVFFLNIFFEVVLLFSVSYAQLVKQ